MNRTRTTSIAMPKQMERKPKRPHPYTENFRQIINGKNGKNGLFQGRADQFVINSKWQSLKSYIIILLSYVHVIFRNISQITYLYKQYICIYMYVCTHTCMHVITLKNKSRSWKEIKEDNKRGMGRRKGKGKLCSFLILSQN